MKVTVCELPNEPALIEGAWSELTAHIRQARSELVLLPEMPFFRWLPHIREAVERHWRDAVEAHERWLARLDELAPAVVLGSRPIEDGGSRFNAAYLREPGGEAAVVHTKHYLPDEPGFWEASWYQRGDADFSTVRAGRANVGFLICTELWFNRHARDYMAQDVHLLACPRATPRPSVEKWLVAGRTAAMVTGAFCLSSNLSGTTSQGGDYAGRGWVIDPEGEVLGLTSPEAPCLSVDVDLAAADRAKWTYPRYVAG